MLARIEAGESPEVIADWILGNLSKCVPPAASSEEPQAIAHDTNTHNDGQDTMEQNAVKSRLSLEQFMSELAGPFQDDLSADVPSPRKSFLLSAFGAQPFPASFMGPMGMCTSPLNLPQHGHLYPPVGTSGVPGPQTWTSVTLDEPLVQRLLVRFFSSSLPYLFFVPYYHFIHDFQEGSRRYCSEALVNSVLGMACKAAMSTSQLISRASFGDAFVGEAKQWMASKNNLVGLPDIQALGILALAEMAQGNEEEASDLANESVRACIRFVLQTQQPNPSPDADFRTVRASTYCGGFTLIR